MNLMKMSCTIAVLNGCAKISGDTYCDIASPMYFDNENIVTYLSEYDSELFKNVIIHNETHQKVCG